MEKDVRVMAVKEEGEGGKKARKLFEGVVTKPFWFRQVHLVLVIKNKMTAPSSEFVVRTKKIDMRTCLQTHRASFKEESVGHLSLPSLPWVKQKINWDDFFSCCLSFILSFFLSSSLPRAFYPGHKKRINRQRPKQLLALLKAFFDIDVLIFLRGFGGNGSSGHVTWHTEKHTQKTVVLGWKTVGCLRVKAGSLKSRNKYHKRSIRKDKKRQPSWKHITYYLYKVRRYWVGITPKLLLHNFGASKPRRTAFLNYRKLADLVLRLCNCESVSRVVIWIC